LAQAIGPGVAGVVAGASSIHAMFSFAAVVSAVGVVGLALAVTLAARPVPMATNAS
jgi:hypothetical protein